jgi:hypothetical protein
MDLADSISSQAAQLWKHLPEDEVDEGEEVFIKADDEGRLMVRTADGDTIYMLADDSYALRARGASAGAHVSMWRNRQLVTETVVPGGIPEMN